MDTRVGLLVESRGLGGAGGLFRAATGDYEVDALGVKLGTAHVFSRVEGDDLVAEGVVARGNVTVDGDVGLEAIVVEGVRGPDAVVQTVLADLEELERASFGLGAPGVAAVGEVVDDGALVACEVPLVPLEGHGVTSRQCDRARGGLGVVAAGNVGGA